MADLKIAGSGVATAELEAWGTIPTAIDGAMETRGKETWRSGDEKVGTGIWECDAGRFKAAFKSSGEFITIISGRMTCIGDDGVTVQLGPGDSMTFPPGWTGEWQVHEPLRKLYAEFKAE